MPKLKSIADKRNEVRRSIIGQWLFLNHHRQSYIADQIGVCRSTVTSRMDNPGNFTVEEVRRLGLNKEQIWRLVQGRE